MSSLVKKPISYSSSTAKPYILSFILFAITLVIGAFFLENIAFFDEVYTTWMSDFEFWVSLPIVLISLGVYLVYVKRHFAIKMNWVFLVFAIILFVGNMVAILCFPDVVSGIGRSSKGETTEYVYNLDAMNRIRFIICFAVGMTYIYLLTAVYPKTLQGGKQPAIIYYAIIALSLFAFVFSIVTENESYQAIFNFGVKPMHFSDCKSFLNNSNTYASLLLLAVISCFYLNALNGRKYLIFLSFVFLFAMFFTISHTCIILTFALFVYFMIVVFVRSFKKRKLYSLIVLFIFIGLIVFVLLSIFADILINVPGLGSLFNFIKTQFSSAMANPISLRLTTWNNVLNTLDTRVKVIFGIGEYNFSFFFAKYEGTSGALNWAHNGFLNQLATGGIIRCVVYAIFLVCILYRIINKMAQKDRGAIILLGSLLALLFHAFTENTSYLSCESKTMLILLSTVSGLFADDKASEKEVVAVAKGKRVFPTFILPVLIVVVMLTATNALLLLLLRQYVTRYVVVALAFLDIVGLFGVILLCVDFRKDETAKGWFRFERWVAYKVTKHDEKVALRLSSPFIKRKKKKLYKKAKIMPY